MRKPSPLASLVFLAALANSGSPLLAQSQQQIPLVSSRIPESIDRVEASLEVDGYLKVADGDSAKSQAAKVRMKAEAALQYGEKNLAVAAVSQAVIRSVRLYDKAKVTIQVGEDQFQPELAANRRLVACEIVGPKATLFCPLGNLTREELDLVSALGNSAILDCLLPGKPVALGDRWKHADDVMAILCGLDEVTKNETQSTLTEVVDNVARLEMDGHLEGKIQGLTTKIDVKAKYRFDLQTARITWFGFLQREDRTQGLTGPGVEAVARLQMKIVPSQAVSSLSEKALAGIDLNMSPERELLVYSPSGGAWQLAHDRRWILITEGPDSAVLRMVDGGEYTAQCNVAMSPDSAAKNQPSLAAFQKDIRDILGDNFKKFLSVSEAQREGGELLYRAEATGEVSGVPIRWFYHQITGADGRRLMLAFTVQESQLDQFAETDRDFVRLVRLASLQTARR